MPALRDLHGQSVAVALALGDRQVTMAGYAKFLENDEVGPALRIEVEDPAGTFELIIKESEWNGQVLPSDQPNCSYLIELSAMPAMMS